MRFTSKSQTTTNSLKQLIEGSYTSLWIELESKKQNWKEILLEVNWRSTHVYDLRAILSSTTTLTASIKGGMMAELESIGRETTMHNEPNKMFDIFSVPLSKSTQEKKKKKKLVFDMHFADVYGKCLNTSLVNWLYQSYRGLWMKIVRRKKKKEILQFGLNISAQRLNTWTAFKLLYFTTIQLVQAVFQRIRTQLS